jgi:hypothetical protein
MTGRPGAIPANDPRLPGIIERVKGGSTLRAEGILLGFTDSRPLRRALRELMGEKGFKELKGSSKRILRASDERLPGVIENLKAGSSLIAESKKLGYTQKRPTSARAERTPRGSGSVRRDNARTEQAEDEKLQPFPGGLLPGGITRRIGVGVISRKKVCKVPPQRGTQAPCTQASKPRRLLGLLNRDQEMKGVAPRGECPE